MTPPAVLSAVREDDELVAAVRNDDCGAAFAEIHERYASRLETYCARLLGSDAEAEDAVQQTFLKAHQDLRRNGKGISLGPWLYTIARNESITILRSRSRRPEVPLNGYDGPPTAAAGEVAERREELREALADIALLPHEQRDALVLTSLRSAAGDEVAATLGCEPAKVKSLVFRARAHLGDLREAREMSCDEVREQINEPSGAGLRRRVIREHLRRCEACATLAERPRNRRNLAAPAMIWPFITAKPFSVLGLGGGAAGSVVAGAGAGSGLLAKAVPVGLAVVAMAGGVAANRDGGPPPGAPAHVSPALSAGQEASTGELSALGAGVVLETPWTADGAEPDTPASAGGHSGDRSQGTDIPGRIVAGKRAGSKGGGPGAEVPSAAKGLSAGKPYTPTVVTRSQAPSPSKGAGSSPPSSTANANGNGAATGNGNAAATGNGNAAANSNADPGASSSKAKAGNEPADSATWQPGNSGNSNRGGDAAAKATAPPSDGNSPSACQGSCAQNRHKADSEAEAGPGAAAKNDPRKSATDAS